ncbi:MAG: DUF2269 domain-containing protein [Dehalobacterium sp.]
MLTGLLVTLTILLPLVAYEVLLIIIGKNKWKFSMKQKNWWLVTHIFFTTVWLGGALGSLLLVFTTTVTANKELIHAAHHFFDFFDKYLNIPGGLGCLLTGIFLTLRTQWGITKYYWIITKLIANVGIIYFGGGKISEWSSNTFELSATNVNVLNNPIYLHDRQMLIIGLASIILVLVFVVAISRFKPWGKRNKNTKEELLTN